ncbi:hypothetical protein K5X82_15810 [Halosquirtibacter xylanolyticus]|uniref:hypothetical protein n=1 Tax=Halosquirtibacter xylanolyticus TaxID=3374599 RepID=UPI003749850F|nr:hypothetical protein K5X82_15810 [Prolixibacteraceae bacterium]
MRVYTFHNLKCLIAIVFLGSLLSCNPNKTKKEILQSNVRKLIRSNINKFPEKVGETLTIDSMALRNDCFVLSYTVLHTPKVPKEVFILHVEIESYEQKYLRKLVYEGMDVYLNLYNRDGSLYAPIIINKEFYQQKQTPEERLNERIRTTLLVHSSSMINNLSPSIMNEISYVDSASYTKDTLKFYIKIGKKVGLMEKKRLYKEFKAGDPVNGSIAPFKTLLHNGITLNLNYYDIRKKELFEINVDADSIAVYSNNYENILIDRAYIPQELTTQILLSL